MQDKTSRSTDEYNLDDMPEPHLPEDSESYDSEEEYSLEDDDTDASEDEETPEEAKRPPHPSAWKLLLGMMINPVQGWKNIRRAQLTVEDVGRECFFPLIGIAAVSCFLEFFWQKSLGLNQVTITALKVFVSFFFGNFLVLLLIKWTFPKDIKDIADSDFGKEFVMFNLSTLALFYTLYGCFPMIGPVLVFLPIWTVYLVLRGSRFFMFPQDKGNLLRTLLCVYIVGTPLAVYWILELFL